LTKIVVDKKSYRVVPEDVLEDPGGQSVGKDSCKYSPQKPCRVLEHAERVVCCIHCPSQGWVCRSLCPVPYMLAWSQLFAEFKLDEK
jgi:hypothetical protein